MLWEEIVPLMKEGYHKELLSCAYNNVPKGQQVYPNQENVFDAMRLTSLKEVRVVIIGQDPYFNRHPEFGPEAHGLCFSVKKGIPIPPSLRNIFKEINNSVYGGQKECFDSDLTRWSEQGVLLLNASLTVISKQPNSHAKLGWHTLTDDIIKTISSNKEHVVFMLWGAFAQKKSGLIETDKHCVLQTSHPSPLSSHRGFLGSDVFVRCNEYLSLNNLQPIKW